MRRFGPTVVDQRDRNRRDHRGNGNRQEVLLEREGHAHQRADDDRRENGPASSDARRPADTGGAHRHRIELAGVGVRHDLGADRGCAGQAHQQEQHLGRHLVAQQRDRYRCEQIHADQHVLDVKAVGQPAAADRTDHGAEVQHQHESQR